MTRCQWIALLTPCFLAITACGNEATSQTQTCETEATESAAPLETLNLNESKSQKWIVGLKNPGPIGNYKFQNSNIEMIDEKTFSIELESSTNGQVLMDSLKQNLDVEFIEPDYQLQSLDVSIDANPLNQWPHLKIHTQQAWNFTRGAPNVVVAVIDSGVDFTHPHLKDSRWVNKREVANGIDDDNNGLKDDINGWNYVEGNGQTKPKNTKDGYHGTHVAGIIAGAENAAKGTVGVSPRVSIMALKFLNEKKVGKTSNAIKAIRYAVDNGAQVINASWGSYNYSNALKAEIDRARSKGVLFVAAAGNMGKDNDTRPFYPASYSSTNIISVTASSKNDAWVSGINYGDQSVDVAAPGLSILSTDRNHSYITRSGSSMAAPFVSAVAALALSVHPQMSYTSLKNVLLNGSDQISKLKSRVKLGRRINAEKTLKLLSSSSSGSFAAGTECL